jgi:hypothetical protein
MKPNLPPGSGMSTLAESHLLSSIQALLRHDERLFQFLFHHQERRLCDTPSELLSRARCFSRGERILIQIVLDFWSDSGSARISEIIEHLDDENLLAFIRAILRLREMDLYVTLIEEPPCFD